MATVTKTGCYVGFDLQNYTSITSTTFLTNQTSGIYCTSVSFTSSDNSNYLSPNIASYPEYTFSIKIKGSTSGEITLYNKSFNSSSIELYNTIDNVLGTLSGNNSTLLKGNITLITSFSSPSLEDHSVWIGFTGTNSLTLTYSTSIPFVPVIAGNPITAADMANLKQYIDFKKSSSSVTITAPSAGVSAANNDWTNYASKAGKSSPGQNIQIDASYFNGYENI